MLSAAARKWCWPVTLWGPYGASWKPNSLAELSRKKIQQCPSEHLKLRFTTEGKTRLKGIPGLPLKLHDLQCSHSYWFIYCLKNVLLLGFFECYFSKLCRCCCTPGFALFSPHLKRNKYCEPSPFSSTTSARCISSSAEQPFTANPQIRCSVKFLISGWVLDKSSEFRSAHSCYLEVLSLLETSFKPPPCLSQDWHLQAQKSLFQRMYVQNIQYSFQKPEDLGCSLQVRLLNSPQSLLLTLLDDQSCKPSAAFQTPEEKCLPHSFRGVIPVQKGADSWILPTESVSAAD